GLGVLAARQLGRDLQRSPAFAPAPAGDLLLGEPGALVVLPGAVEGLGLIQIRSPRGRCPGGQAEAQGGCPPDPVAPLGPGEVPPRGTSASDHHAHKRIPGRAVADPNERVRIDYSPAPNGIGKVPPEEDDKVTR